MKTTNFNIKGLVRKSSLALIVAVAFIATSCEEEMIEPMDNSTSEFMSIPATLDAMSENPDLYLNKDTRLKVDNRVPFPRSEFRTLRSALIKTDLMGTVARNTLTIFAPTDMAFENLFSTLGVKGLNDLPVDLLKSVLLYHAVEGAVYSTDLVDGYVNTVNGASIKVDLTEGAMINSSNVIAANIKALNGVIHAIDEVMLPPTIVDLAVANSNFSILVEAVVKADLAETLSSGEFTVFAPTNQAFVNLLGELGYASLDAIPVQLLKKVLLYHAVPSKVLSTDLPAEAISVESAMGESFEINATIPAIVDAGARTANLIGFDVQGTNGVIHVIDRVILPNLTALSR